MRPAALLLLGFALAGCESGTREASAPVRARFYLEAAEASTREVTLPQSGVHISIQPKAVLTEFDVIRVELAGIEMVQCLKFHLTPAATRDLSRLAEVSQGRRLVLIVDGLPLGAQRIDQPPARGAVHPGVLQIFAEMPDSALPALVASLNKTSAALQSAAVKR